MKQLTQKEKDLIITQHEAGVSVSKLCKTHNISRITFYNWLKTVDKTVKPQDNYKLNQKLTKNKQIIEVLQTVNCTINSPLKEKLYELEKLHDKYSVYVLCEALNVSRGTYYNHILRNKKK